MLAPNFHPMNLRPHHHRMAASWRTKKMRRIMVRRPNWNSLPYSMRHRHWRSSTWHHQRSRSHMRYWQSRPSWHHSWSQWSCWPHWNCWSCWHDAGWNSWPHWNCWTCRRDYPWRRHHWWASWRCCAHYSTEHLPSRGRGGASSLPAITRTIITARKATVRTMAVAIWWAKAIPVGCLDLSTKTGCQEPRNYRSDTGPVTSSSLLRL